MTPEKISRFAGKWLARLPQPFSVEDEQAGYGWELTIQQIELATTQVLDTAAAGRVFFDQLIRDNLDIGRPDRVRIVFDRQRAWPTAAQALGLSRTAAYELIRTGEWPTPVFRLGRLIRIPTAPILELLGIGIGAGIGAGIEPAPGEPLHRPKSTTTTATTATPATTKRNAG